MKTNTKQSVIALLMAALMAVPFAFAEGEPSNVIGVKTVAKYATTLTVSWQQSTPIQGKTIDHYRIYYGKKSVQGGAALAYEVEVDTPDNKTTYDLTNLETGVAYYMAVTAVDSKDMESLEYSIEASGTPTSETVAQSSSSTADTAAPTVMNVMAMDKNHALVRFSEKVVLPNLLPEAAFTVTEQINPANVLEVMSAKLFAEDLEGKTVVIETEDQTKDMNYVVTASVAITDVNGNPISSGNDDSAMFMGSDKVVQAAAQVTETAPQQEATTAEALLEETPAVVTADTTAPEDITNLVLTFKEELEKFAVVMNWTASLNTAKDLVDQMLYMSMDLGVTYDTGKSLGPSSSNHEVGNLEGGKEYTFKLTTKDASGNESVGVVKSIRLPQTGPAMGMMIVGSAFVASRVLKRRKQDDEV